MMEIIEKMSGGVYALRCRCAILHLYSPSSDKSTIVTCHQCKDAIPWSVLLNKWENRNNKKGTA